MTLFGGDDKLDLPEVVRGLLNLEINTIIKSNMTAERMPALPHAILDIAGEYARKLVESGVDVTLFQLSSATARPALDPWATLRSGSAPISDGDRLRVSADTFDALRWAANRANSVSDGAPPDRAVSMLIERICNNSDMIKAILTRLNDMPFVKAAPNRAELALTPPDPKGWKGVSANDWLAVKKIWEVGTEEVVAQTVIQLDGDVYTRFRPQTDPRTAELILTVHQSSTEVAVSSWRHLLDVVIKIAGDVATAVLKK